MIDETAWQGNKAVSLASCWSWDETLQWAWSPNCLANKNVGQLLTLYYVGCVRVRWLGKCVMKLLPVFHVMRVPWKTSLKCIVAYFLTYAESPCQILISVGTHFLLIMESDNNARTGVISLTACWPWYEMCMPRCTLLNCITTHRLFSLWSSG